MPWSSSILSPCPENMYISRLRFNNLLLFNKIGETRDGNGRTETGAWDEESKCWAIYPAHKARLYSTHPQPHRSVYLVHVGMALKVRHNHIAVYEVIVMHSHPLFTGASRVHQASWLSVWTRPQQSSVPADSWVAVASTQWCRAGHGTIVTKGDGPPQWYLVSSLAK